MRVAPGTAGDGGGFELDMTTPRPPEDDANGTKDAAAAHKPHTPARGPIKEPRFSRLARGGQGNKAGRPGHRGKTYKKAAD